MAQKDMYVSDMPLKASWVDIYRWLTCGVKWTDRMKLLICCAFVRLLGAKLNDAEGALIRDKEEQADDFVAYQVPRHMNTRTRLTSKLSSVINYVIGILQSVRGREELHQVPEILGWAVAYNRRDKRPHTSQWLHNTVMMMGHCGSPNQQVLNKMRALCSCIYNVAPSCLLREHVPLLGFRKEITGVAQAIYHDRDIGLLPVLADLLEDDEQFDMAQHCREIVHCHRGCWVVDQILGLR
jgi:hypothetical protein